MSFNVTPVKTLDAQPIIRGTKSFAQDALKRYDPQYTGYSEIFVLKLPKIMENNSDNAIKQHAKNIRTIIEYCSTSYSGEPEISPETAQVQMGSSDQVLTVHTKTNFEGNSFSINCLETHDEPLRHAIEKYHTMLGDPYNKAALAFKEAGLEKILENYAMVIAIVQLDPTLQKIQNITVWEAVTITGSIDRDNLNYTAGEIDIVQPKSIQLSGIPRLNAFQYQSLIEPLLLARTNLYKSWTNMDTKRAGTV